MSMSMAPEACSSPSDGKNHWQSANQVIKPKMDLSKALAIMGFQSSRVLDSYAGHDPRAELSGALCKRMAELDARKNGQPEPADPRRARRRPQPGFASQKAGGGGDGKKHGDEVRMLHEAYQFLSRRYLVASKGEEDEEAGSAGISPLAAMEQAKKGYVFDERSEYNEQ